MQTYSHILPTRLFCDTPPFFHEKRHFCHITLAKLCLRGFLVLYGNTIICETTISRNSITALMK